MHGGQAGNRKLTGVRARCPRVHVAFGVETGTHSNHVRVNVEHVGDDLRGGRFVALALRAGTDSNDNFAIDIQLAVRALRIP